MLDGTLASSRACQLAPALATACGQPSRAVLVVGGQGERRSGRPGGRWGRPCASRTRTSRGWRPRRRPPCRRRRRPRRPRRRRRPRSSYAGPGSPRPGAGRWWCPRRPRSSAPATSAEFARSAVRTTGISVTSPVSPVARRVRRAPRSGRCRGRRRARRRRARAPARRRRTGPATATMPTPTRREGATSLRANSGGETCGGSDTGSTLDDQARGEHAAPAGHRRPRPKALALRPGERGPLECWGRSAVGLSRPRP